MLTCYKKAVAVRNLLAVKSRWTTGAYARNSLNSECDPHEESAVKFCLGGAMMHEDAQGLWDFINRTCFDIYNLNFTNVNDRLGHKEVMNVLDRVVCVAALAPPQ